MLDELMKALERYTAIAFVTICLFLTNSAALANSKVGKSGKPTLVVLPLELPRSLEGFRYALSREFISSLDKYYEPINGQVLEKALEELYGQNSSASGSVSALAKEFNGEIIADAIVEEAEGYYGFDFRIINVVSGKLEKNVNERCWDCSPNELIFFLKEKLSSALNPRKQISDVIIGINPNYTCMTLTLKSESLGCVDFIEIGSEKIYGNLERVLAEVARSYGRYDYITFHLGSKVVARKRDEYSLSDTLVGFLASSGDWDEKINKSRASREADEKWFREKAEEEARQKGAEVKKQREAEAKAKEKAELAALQKLQKENELIPVGSGTGFAIDHLGNVVSNQHVIEGCESISVLSEGEFIGVTVLAQDPKNDLALLKLEKRPDAFFYLDDEPPSITQDVYVGGFPFGEVISSEVKVTKGIVSSLAGLSNDYSRFMVDAALQPGNSGGPIFSDEGVVLGVAVAKLDVLAFVQAFDTIPEGSNFGIKNSVLREFLSSNQIKIPSQPFFSMGFEREKLINEGIFHIVCFAKRKNIPKLREQKVLFQNIK